MVSYGKALDSAFKIVKNTLESGNDFKDECIYLLKILTSQGYACDYVYETAEKMLASKDKNIVRGGVSLFLFGLASQDKNKEYQQKAVDRLCEFAQSVYSYAKNQEKTSVLQEKLKKGAILDWLKGEGL